MRLGKMNPASFLVLLVIAAALLACDLGSVLSPSPTKPVVTITAPAHGAQVNMGQEVLVQASATDAKGVVRIELWVNGQLHATAQSPSPQLSHTAVLKWTPSTAGSHTLLVKAINVSNLSSDPAAVTVTVANPNPPTLTPTVKATVSPKPTAVITPTTAPVSVTATAPTTAITAPSSTATVATECQNDAVFVEHVTVPDGTRWMPGQTFNKIWRVKNSGTCSWGPGYDFVFVGGEAMTAQSGIVVPNTAAGATADLLVAMTAPALPGPHTGEWRLRSPKIGLFGATLKVSIDVVGPPTPPPGCPAIPSIESFSADPATIRAGESSTLSWGKVDFATSASIDQGIGGIGTPDQAVVTPAQTTTYTLSATGCGGTVTKLVTVTVTAP